MIGVAGDRFVTHLAGDVKVVPRATVLGSALHR